MHITLLFSLKLFYSPKKGCALVVHIYTKYLGDDSRHNSGPMNIFSLQMRRKLEKATLFPNNKARILISALTVIGAC